MKHAIFFNSQLSIIMIKELKTNKITKNEIYNL